MTEWNDVILKLYQCALRKEGLSSKRKIGTFHKFWSAFEFGCQKFLWLEVEGIGIFQNVV